MMDGFQGWCIWGLIVATSLVTSEALAQSKVTEGFTARGCCPWCGEHILDALDCPGVKRATWDQWEQCVTVTYRPRKVNLRQLQRRVAESGHDTDAFRASEESYLALPPCCHYRE